MTVLLFLSFAIAFLGAMVIIFGTVDILPAGMIALFGGLALAYLEYRYPLGVL